jgi:hypothetical protein
MQGVRDLIRGGGGGASKFSHAIDMCVDQN